ncbi:hypothetical protein PVAND_004155 [Polypedilum vanderplanki]|uniref:Cation-dependent mannose-6-phosphate receptor n=1 Tax=Polypedilum vanderplanki TaxID=319348 RepID=A0A9J6BWA4_POLVA|nr:hypothetical protein PVAND_004155 [Polypedilum vanderplanki]
MIVSVNASTCELKNVCECVYNDGSEYDLRGTLRANNEYLETIATNDIHIFFSPCKNAKSIPNILNDTASNECKNGYTLCLLDVSQNKAFLLGTEVNTNFLESENEVFMKYGSATIQLICTPNSNKVILYAPNNTTQSDVKLILFSKSACKTSPLPQESYGFFYTFFLILFIIIFSYLIIGILYNYFFVGARGYELLPHFDFWTRVWSSIKLGFYFVKNGFKVLPTEDSYDAI